MSYDLRSKHHNDHRSGYKGRPNGHTAGFKRNNNHRKDHRSYNSNGFRGKIKDSLLFDGIGYYREPSSYNDTNNFYSRNRFQRHDRDDYRNRDLSPCGGEGDNDDDSGKDSCGRHRRPSFSSEQYGSNRDYRNTNVQYRDCYRNDRREKYGNQSNNDGYDTPSRSPSRDRGRESDVNRDRERNNDADRKTAIPSKGNIRTDFSIHEDGHLYSDQREHHRHRYSISDQHLHTAFAERKGTPQWSRWDLEPVNTLQTAIYQYHTDQSSSLQSLLPSVSPTTDMFRPSKSPTPETTTMPRPPFAKISPSHRPATVLSTAISVSTATSVTTANTQGEATNHVQHSTLTTRSALLEEHRQIESVQQKAQSHPPTRSQDHHSMLISTAAETCKALTNLRKQTGLITADVSVSDLLGKRSVGRPSKVRLETEDAARLGINRAKSEMKALEQGSKQQQLQVQGIIRETDIAKTRHRVDVVKTDAPGRTARLSVSAAVTTTTSSSSVIHNPQQIRGHCQQEIQPQPTRTLKTRKEWELLRKGLQDRGEPTVEAPRRRLALPGRSEPEMEVPHRDLPRQIVAPAINFPLVKPLKEELAPAKIFLAKPLPSMVIVRKDQHICLDAETNTDTENMEDDDGYLGSPHLEQEYRMKVAGDTLDGQLAPKSTPPQPKAFYTPYPVLLELGEQLFNKRQESSHSENTAQAHCNAESGKKMWPNSSTFASITYLGPMYPKTTSPESAFVQERCSLLSLRNAAAGKERSPIGLEKQLMTSPDRQPPSDNSVISVSSRPSILKCKPSLTPSYHHRRVTFTNLKPDKDFDSHVATNLLEHASPSLAMELSRSVSPSPPPLTSFTLSSPPPIEEGATVDNIFSTSASSPASVSLPTPPSQGLPLSDNKSPNGYIDTATDSPATTDISDGAVEVEEARKKLLAYMKQLDATITTKFTADTELSESTASSTFEESAETRTVTGDNQTVNTEITSESDAVPVSNPQSSISMSAVDKQAEAEAARRQVIERIRALPIIHPTQSAGANRQPGPSLMAESFTPTPNDWNVNQITTPYYGYWCQCAMEGRQCVCGSNTYSPAIAPSGYCHSHSHYTTHTTTDYYYSQGHHCPARQHIVHSSHEYNWNYYHHPWGGGQQWVHPAYYGHDPSFAFATQPPLPAGPPPAISSRPTQVSRTVPSID